LTSGGITNGAFEFFKSAVYFWGDEFEDN